MGRSPFCGADKIVAGEKKLSFLLSILINIGVQAFNNVWNL